MVDKSEYSNLGGFIELMESTEAFSDESVAEIGRVLDLLRDQGWGGTITADKALSILIDGTSQAGWDDGYQVGYRSGYAAGHRVGDSEGWCEGLRDGINGF